MTTMKKHIELLETKIEDLEKTINHQKELMTMMRDNMINQKMTLEMIIQKLNSQPQQYQASCTTVASQVSNEKLQTEPMKSSMPLEDEQQTTLRINSPNIFPINRRAMV